MNIGIDIIEIKRIEKAILTKDGFKPRVFTTSEIGYCESRGKQQFASFAGVYAAKEAFVKALGLGFRKGSWQELEIGHDEWGAPIFTCTGIFSDLLKERGYKEIKVSISHCKEYAVAQVVLM